MFPTHAHNRLHRRLEKSGAPGHVDFDGLGFLLGTSNDGHLQPTLQGGSSIGQTALQGPEKGQRERQQRFGALNVLNTLILLQQRPS